MKQKDRNLLELIPKRQCEWESVPEGKISLVVPRFKNRLFKKIALKLGKSEFVRIHLDKMGSNVWSLVDGIRSVEEIGKIIPKEKDETDQGLYDRLSEFIVILARNRFIQFKNY